MNLSPDSGTIFHPKSYRQIVGSLIYLTITQPDLSYPIGVNNQFMPTIAGLDRALPFTRKRNGRLCWVQGRQCGSMNNIRDGEEPAYERKQDTHREKQRDRHKEEIYSK